MQLIFISDSSSNRIQFQGRGATAEAAFSTLHYSSPLPLCGGASARHDIAQRGKAAASRSLVELAHVHLHLLISREQRSNEVNVLHYNIHEAVGHPSRVQAEADINTLNLGPESFGPSGE